ncbi:hypothetical protein AMECASPLE_015023 [Ameca splendens]|uniref:Uncharacterized protein n=1 Tax=Ameca splendens TaxID=208324 RepID=A0ABV0Y1N7_9TELE
MHRAIHINHYTLINPARSLLRKGIPLQNEIEKPTVKENCNLATMRVSFMAFSTVSKDDVPGCMAKLQELSLSQAGFQSINSYRKIKGRRTWSQQCSFISLRAYCGKMCAWLSAISLLATWKCYFCQHYVMCVVHSSPQQQVQNLLTSLHVLVGRVVTSYGPVD